MSFFVFIERINKLSKFALEKAKEQLYMIASLVDFDAAFILENLVYPNEDVLDWFFEYFCEYRIDERLIDKLIYVKE